MSAPVAALLAIAITTSSPGTVRILTPSDLARRLADVTVLDAREKKEFRAEHVPSSRHVDWRDWTRERPSALGALFGHPANWGKVPIPDDRLLRRLRDLGLSNSRGIVVVGAPGGWGEEGRIAWNLLYWGADEVALLDGGYPAWKAAGYAVETGEIRRGPPGDFVLRLRPERRVDLDGVKAVVETGSRALLDARTPEEWAGEKLAGQRRGGHIPGARLVPEKALFRSDGRYVGAEELRALTGLTPGSPQPAIYCVGGVRSALLALLLEARLGIEAANYDGSIWEWAAHPDLPLVVPRAER